MTDNKNAAILFGAVVVAAAVAAGVYYYKQRFGQAAAPPPASTATPAAPNVAPPIQHPLPQAEARDEPLPPLEQSDEPARDALTRTFGDGILAFIVPNNFIRNFVATVDNLPRAKLAARLNPVKPVPGDFATRGNEDAATLSPDNYARYAQLVQLFQTTDTQKLVDTYVHFYPLLQSAYEDLGYPDRYFNDRVVEVIDHLLATPEPKEPIGLKQPKVFYEFEDPRLEGLSAGQKALIRMGPAQAQAAKTKLQDIRNRIAKQAPH
ncbi:MAG TPA: DUF3014 domain-containing protein [Steroidobacteraceae bacterium]|nr:DUF3014 domain-containing protein [Steroidobacteraceae bacterium]